MDEEKVSKRLKAGKKEEEDMGRSGDPLLILVRSLVRLGLQFSCNTCR